MGLTGWPLLLVGIVASLAAVAGTVWFWRGDQWWRPVVRTVAILGCEALVLFTAGLAVNRSLEIFPSWSALLHQRGTAPPPTTVADPTTRLDDWLRGRALEGARNGLVFQWRPNALAAWHLPTPPMVYVPPRYFTAKAARFPVVLVAAPAGAGPAEGGWDDHKVSVIVPRPADAFDPAVLVFLRVDHPDDTLLTERLPKQLDEDLRTSARGWAVIGVGTDAPLAFDALRRDEMRFWAAAAVAAAPGGLPKGLTPPHVLGWQATVMVVAGPPSAAKPGVKVVPRPDVRVAQALQWAYRQMPAPLTAPITQPADPAAPR